MLSAADYRRALVAATTRERAGRVGPALLLRLVEAGTWTPAAALAHAYRDPPEVRWRTLNALRMHVPPSDQDAVAADALAAARAVPDLPARAAALAALDPGLSGEALGTIRDAPDAWPRVAVLRDLAPALPATLHPAAAETARGFTSPTWRAWALFGLAPHHPAVLPDALAAIAAESNQTWRAYALAEFAPLLAPAQLPAAMDLARQLHDPADRARALVGLASRLPAGDRAEAFAAARAIHDPAKRAEAIAGLARHHTAEVLDEALPLLVHAPAQVLRSLAPHLDAEQLDRTVESVAGNHRALAVLAPHVSGARRDRILADVLDAVQRNGTDADLAGTVQDLAHLLNPPLLARAVDLIRPLPRGDLRAKALTALAAHAPDTLVPLVLAATAELATADERTAVVDALAPRLPDDLVPTALAAAQLHGDQRRCAAALAALLHHVPQTNQAALVRDALDRIGVSPTWAAAWAATGLVGQLSPAAAAQFAAGARQVPEQETRARTLARLVPHLDEPDRSAAVAQVLAGAWSMRDAEQVLGPIAPYLTASQLDEALQAAPYSYGLRVENLVALAPYVPPERMPQILTDLDEDENPYNRAWAIDALAPHLPGALVPEALAAARRIGLVPACRSQAVVALLGRLDAGDAAQAWHVEWDTALTAPAAYDRTEALVELAAHAPPDERDAALGTALDAVRTCGESPPMTTDLLHRLLPDLPPRPRLDAMTTLADLARQHPDPAGRAGALTRMLAAGGDRALAAEAWQQARAIPESDRRLRAMVELAPYLPDDGLGDVLARIAGVSTPLTRHHHLAAVGAYLPVALLQDALALVEPGAAHRSETLAALTRRACELDPPDHAFVHRVLAMAGRHELLELAVVLGPALADPAAAFLAVSEIQRRWP